MSFVSESVRDKVMKEILQDPQNRICFDCGSKEPKWASPYLGILVCYECAARHRSYGTHISFIRSIDLDKWKKNQLISMQLAGNSYTKERFLQLGIPQIGGLFDYQSELIQKFRGELADKVQCELEKEIPEAAEGKAASKKEEPIAEKSSNKEAIQIPEQQPIEEPVQNEPEKEEIKEDNEEEEEVPNKKEYKIEIEEVDNEIREKYRPVYDKVKNELKDVIITKLLDKVRNYEKIEMNLRKENEILKGNIVYILKKLLVDQRTVNTKLNSKINNQDMNQGNYFDTMGNATRNYKDNKTFENKLNGYIKSLYTRTITSRDTASIE